MERIEPYHSADFVQIHHERTGERTYEKNASFVFHFIFLRNVRHGSGAQCFKTFGTIFWNISDNMDGNHRVNNDFFKYW